MSVCVKGKIDGTFRPAHPVHILPVLNSAPLLHAMAKSKGMNSNGKNNKNLVI